MPGESVNIMKNMAIHKMTKKKKSLPGIPDNKSAPSTVFVGLRFAKTCGILHAKSTCQNLFLWSYFWAAGRTHPAADTSPAWEWTLCQPGPLPASFPVPSHPSPPVSLSLSFPTSTPLQHVPLYHWLTCSRAPSFCLFSLWSAADTCGQHSAVGRQQLTAGRCWLAFPKPGRFAKHGEGMLYRLPPLHPPHPTPRALVCAENRPSQGAPALLFPRSVSSASYKCVFLRAE